MYIINYVIIYVNRYVIRILPYNPAYRQVGAYGHELAFPCGSTGILDTCGI